MKIVIQRVNHASVTSNGEPLGKIKKGYLLLVGAVDSDTPQTAEKLVNKIAKLRVFADENGKMNLNIKQVNGGILSVSQFTLLANLKKGNRPTFTGAGNPKHAKQIYGAFNQSLSALDIPVKTGEFGADMQVDLENDGPATFLLDSEAL